MALAGEDFDVGITWHDDEQGAQGTAQEVRALGRRAEVRRLDLEQLPRAADVVDELADALAGSCGPWSATPAAAAAGRSWSCPARSPRR